MKDLGLFVHGKGGSVEIQEQSATTGKEVKKITETNSSQQ